VSVTAAAAAMPEPGVPLRLETDDGAVLTTVVRAVRAAQVLELERPEVAQLRAVPVGAGVEGTVHWGRADAEYRARVRLLDPAGPVLQVVVSSRWTRVQRRAHVRARYAAQVSLVDLAGLRWHGATIDVSESGLRCRVERRARLAQGDRLMASLRLGSEQFDVASEVQWITAGDERHHEIGVRFMDPGPQADAIRAWVFAFQIRSRELQ
jgi:hypothetical protein